MIQPRSTTVGEILTLSKHFVVPKNQRGYAWEPSEAGEFLDDLELESGSGRGLFLGTFIFNIADEAHDNIKIVDGQQRMTTIFLLLIGCRMLAKTLKADGIAQETQKRKFCKTQDLEKTTNELISSLRKQLASEDEFSSRFCQISYNSDTVPVIAYIFDRLSNFNVAPGERVPIFDPQTGVARYNHNIEHFLPQKPDQETVIDSGTRQALDNIGNLLAISFRANSSLGNLAPNKKIQKLKGDLSKKVQNLHYVREFIDKYGDKAESWNEEAIIKRGLDMATEAYRQVWKIS
jgi:hypothetical protein